MTKKQLRTCIIDTQLTNELIFSEEITTFSLVHQLSISKFAILEWLAKRNLIKNTMFCGKCGDQMRLSEFKRLEDGYLWLCKPSCKNTTSVRINSLFYKSKISLKNQILLLYFWCIEFTQDQICYELKLNKKTVCEKCKIFREICVEAIENETGMLGGFNENGDLIDVEVDESCFFTRKYNRGRLGSSQWVFGIFERGSRKVYLVPIERRDSYTLLRIITEKVVPGTRIITDGWASYRQLESLGFEHGVVNHSFNFVSPDDSSIHTQNIESTWGHAKRKMKFLFGSRVQFLGGYLSEFLFRRNVCKFKIFNNMLITITRLDWC